MRAEWTDETVARLWQLHDLHGPDYAKLADGLPGFTRSQVRHKVLKGRPANDPPPLTLESEPSPSPVTLDEFLAERAVDLSVWDVERHLFNEWGDPGAPSHQLKVWLKRKPGAELEQLGAQILADIRADTALRPRIRHKPLPPSADPCALEVCVFDLHIGKLAWNDETGHGHYDSDIAEAYARAAVDDLLHQAKGYPIDRVILPIGNDLLHVDNLISQTTAGTRQDADTRYYRMFRRARGVMSWMIARCAEIAPVEVVIVQGNHDKLSSWHVGEVLAAEYAHDPRITFDTAPRARKYVQYGANLIGYAHGNTAVKKLPQTMAVEQKHRWAETIYREWHIGHRHKSEVVAPIYVDDEQGVTVRTIRSLCAPDAWHSEEGWVGGTQGAEAYVWRKRGGLRSILMHMVEPVQQAA